MKLKYIFISAALAAMSLSSCHKSTDNHEHDEDDHDHDHTSEVAEAKGGNHNSEEIIFSPEKAKKFGVTTLIVQPTTFNKVIKVSGEITGAPENSFTVVARSAGIVKISSNITPGLKVKAGSTICTISSDNIVGNESNEKTKIEYQTAKRELDRITPLFKEKIVTEKEYLTAKEIYAKAQLAHQNTRSGSVAKSEIAGVVSKLLVKDGDYVEIGAPIGIISKNTKLILRADLPDSYYSEASSITTANFKTSYSNSINELKSLNARLISNSAVAQTTPGYVPIYFEFNNNGSFIVGSYAEIYLIGSAKSKGIVVPIQSVTEELGKYYTYIQIDKEGYEKKLVTIGENDGKSIEILSGLSAGERVVTNGAVFIKLAANSGKVPEGHSHSH